MATDPLSHNKQTIINTNKTKNIKCLRDCMEDSEQTLKSIIMTVCNATTT